MLMADYLSSTSCLFDVILFLIIGNYLFDPVFLLNTFANSCSLMALTVCHQQVMFLLNDCYSLVFLVSMVLQRPKYGRQTHISHVPKESNVILV